VQDDRDAKCSGIGVQKEKESRKRYGGKRKRKEACNNLYGAG